MNATRNPAIMMIDVFSILAISVFVLYTVTAGQSVSTYRPEICIVNIRLAIVPDDDRKEVLPAYPSDMLQFTYGTDDAIRGWSRVFETSTTHGLQLVIEDPSDIPIRLLIEEILDDRVIGRRLDVEAQTVGGQVRQFSLSVGQWNDPEIFAGCGGL